MSPPTTGFDPLVFSWDAWRPEGVARRLVGVDVPWYVAAGWSIDLFLGSQRREHDDLDIAAPAARFAELADAFAELEFFAINDSIASSIEHQPQAPAMDGSHQTWGLDRLTHVWRVDVFREPSEGDSWVFRRDESIRLTGGAHIERTSDGLPYSRPELTLLFKAKQSRPKDDDDLAAVLDVLDPDRREYLAELLATIHPGHRWLDLISQPG